MHLIESIRLYLRLGRSSLAAHKAGKAPPSPSQSHLDNAANAIQIAERVVDQLEEAWAIEKAPEEALAKIRQALKDHPDTDSSRVLRGLILNLYNGYAWSAISNLSDISKLDGPNQAAAIGMIRRYADRGESDLELMALARDVAETRIAHLQKDERFRLGQTLMWLDFAPPEIAYAEEIDKIETAVRARIERLDSDQTFQEDF